MASNLYLAMTAKEAAETPSLPPHVGWMVCPVSPDWAHPPLLPPGSALILTDEAELSSGRAAEKICNMTSTAEWSGVILDFQRRRSEGAADLAARLVSTLPCPVAVPEEYAAELDCPVFLPPCPHHTPLIEHLAPWQGRELWLDLARDAEVLMLTETGAAISPLPLPACPPAGFREERLHCHYAVETGADFARFTLWRTWEDLEELAQEAEGLGIHTFVGLWKEWYKEKDDYCDL